MLAIVEGMPRSPALLLAALTLLATSTSLLGCNRDGGSALRRMGRRLGRVGEAHPGAPAHGERAQEVSR